MRPVRHGKLPLSHTFRDFALYVGIAVSIVGAVVLWPIVLPERFSSSPTWFMFIVATAFLCVFMITMYWHQRRSGRVWMLLALLLVIHVVGYSILLSYVPRFASAWFLLAVPAEIIASASIVKICLNVLPKRVTF